MFKNWESLHLLLLLYTLHFIKCRISMYMFSTISLLKLVMHFYDAKKVFLASKVKIDVFQNSLYGSTGPPTYIPASHIARSIKTILISSNI